MDEKRFVQLGRSQVDLSKLARDPRGIWDLLAEVLEKDWQENRYVQFHPRLHFFAEADDIAEWDNSLLYRFPPRYNEPEKTCIDCYQGPCNLEETRGCCGLEFEPYQARLALRAACRGCLSQMAASRELLNHALRAFGRDKPVAMGRLVVMEDLAPSIGTVTGMYVKNLGDLERALSYAEVQLTKLFAASFSAKLTVSQFEEMTFHAGSMLMLAMDVAELIKISCFGFNTAAERPLDQLADWPPATTLGGMGSVERKPVVVFLGDDFLAGWFAVDYLKKNELTEKVEICGIGPAGDDIIRFYDRCRVITTMVQSSKSIRAGFADVIVASRGCVSLDTVADAQRVESRLIWTSAEGNAELPDMTEAPVAEIVAHLLKETPAVVVKDPEKAGEVAIKVAQQVKRKGNYVLSDDSVMKEAQKCIEDCDRCFNSCPNSLQVSRAVRAAAREGVRALVSVEKGCYLCGRCEQSCPEKIPLTDMMVAALASRAPEDKFIWRAGRGPIPEVELRADAFALQWGNAPGQCFVLGCGDAKVQEDIGYIAHELTARSCMVYTAGCGAAELARHFNPAQQKFIFQEFTAESQARNILNCGGCTAHAHLMDHFFKLARLAAGISHYGNYAETSDYNHTHMPEFVIMWGAIPERMFALAAGFARNGTPVIVGPESGFRWKRFLMGNKYDRSRWWMYDGITGERKELAPAPKHLIIPVETKEEALTMAAGLLPRPTQNRDSRGSSLTIYTDFYDLYFGGSPDDWHLFLRSDMELPQRRKFKLLQELRDKYGFEVDRMRVKRFRHPDGRLQTPEEYARSYEIEQGRYCTYVGRLVTGMKKKEGEK